MTFFPFTVPATETPHFTSSSYDFRPTFVRHRPANMTWFCYDVVIHSPTQVEFVVFDMRDVCRGGIGDEINRFEATVDAALTRKFIEKEARHAALCKRELELAEAERIIVERYTQEILATVDAAEDSS